MSISPSRHADIRRLINNIMTSLWLPVLISLTRRSCPCSALLLYVSRLPSFFFVFLDTEKHFLYFPLQFPSHPLHFLPFSFPIFFLNGTHPQSQQWLLIWVMKLNDLSGTASRGATLMLRREKVRCQWVFYCFFTSPANFELAFSYTVCSVHCQNCKINK